MSFPKSNSPTASDVANSKRNASVEEKREKELNADVGAACENSGRRDAEL